MRRFARGLAALGVAAGLSIPGAAASASTPHTVDPLTMTPELNPSFAPWTCFETGTQIICQGSKYETYANEATDLPCGEHTVYVTGSERAYTTRWHTLDGLATKTSLQGEFRDSLSLSPTGDGKSVIGSGQWHKHYDYPVPGDPAARVLTETGAILRAVSPGEGLLFQDTGSVTYNPGEEYEGVAEMHGVHDRFTGGPSWEEAVCDALTTG